LASIILALISYGASIGIRAAATPSAVEDAIQLEVSPRVCTLAANDSQCQAQVHASWRSNHPESLCLIVLERREIKRCWEDYSQGTYSIKLEFSDDLNFQLRDPELREIFASQVLHVIREAIRFRHKRRAPWNVFE
jgi:hypothetical protein